VGTERPEHQYHRARLAFITAVQDLHAAMHTWIAAEVPLYGPTGAPLPGWTKEQYDATAAAAAAWQELVRRRKAYQSALRILREGSGR